MNILVSNFDNSGEDVMIFGTSLNASTIEQALKTKNQTFDDVCEVQDNEVQYYCYDPLFASQEWDKRVLNNIKSN